MSKIVLAIDPGPTDSAFVVARDSDLVFLGFNIVPSVETLSIIAQYRPDIVVCEDIKSYGMAVGESVFETCRWIGEYRHMTRIAGKEWHTVNRIDEKKTICHNTKAKDGNIRQALIDRFGPPGTKKHPGKLFGFRADLWAALAVLVTYLDTRNAQAA